MSHKFETLLYAIVFTFWTVRLYYKLYDKKIKKYVLSIGILIVFWMLIRIFKSVIGINSLERLSWYLYYIPLIFIPSLFYICSNNKISFKKKIIIYTISTILFLLVLTNDYHEIVFKFNNGLSLYDDYKHNIGYYIISIWIFFLFGGGMFSLAINRLKIKKDIRAFLPLIVLFIGVIYTVCYVIDIWGIRNINMSVANSILICLGIELALYLDLIPNNKRYIKTFENSNLNMVIVSLDGNTIYNSKVFNEIPSNIKIDIENNNVKDIYKDNNIIYNIKKNKDSYVILRNDLTLFNTLKEEVSKKKKQLLKLQENIKLEEKTKKELYEINLRKDVVSKIENSLNEKRILAKNILNKDNISNTDLEKIKRIIIYSKKKSSIMISELNGDIYNEDNVKNILNELISSSFSLNIKGLVVVKNKFNIDARVMSILYDTIYDVIDNISDTTIMIYISSNKNKLNIKLIIGSLVSIEDKLKLNKDITLKEKKYDTDTELVFYIKGCDKI